MSVATGAASLLAILFAIRAARSWWLRRILMQPIHDAPESWDEWPTTDGLAVSALGVTLADAILRLSHIDPVVFTTLSRRRPAHGFTGINALVSHLRDVHDRGDVAFAGLVAHEKGHVGEHMIAESLRASGHHLQMASGLNQEGWTVLLDGQPVQIKSGLGVDEILEHQRRFPSIPVITVSVHAETFSDNEMVTTLADISGVEIAETTRQSLDGMVDGLDGAEGDFPVVRFVLSAARNTTRVLRREIDAMTALEHTSADTIGVGAGGLIGGKTGAAIGGVVGGQGNRT